MQVLKVTRNITKWEIDDMIEIKWWISQWKEVTPRMSMDPWLLWKVSKMLLSNKSIELMEKHSLDNLICWEYTWVEVLKFFIEILEYGNRRILENYALNTWHICDKAIESYNILLVYTCIDTRSIILCKVIMCCLTMLDV